jgi:hypothetical protein
MGDAESFHASGHPENCRQWLRAGAKPMLCTKPSNLGQALCQIGKQLFDLGVVTPTSQSKISL